MVDANKERPAPIIASAWGKVSWRRVLVAAAAVYIGSIWFDSFWGVLPDRLLPHSLRYFTQVAKLFPKAADDTIEYRAEVYDCARGQFIDYDVRPLFPIHPDDDECPFHRAMFFYRRENRVMAALDDYITSAHNRRVAAGIEAPVGRIGGVLLRSIRVPIPEVGSTIERYQRKPASSFPKDWRPIWYITAPERREARCGVSP
jgi:hypothetical protein